jgi:hypothetical protein
MFRIISTLLLFILSFGFTFASEEKYGDLAPYIKVSLTSEQEEELNSLMDRRKGAQEKVQ